MFVIDVFNLINLIVMVGKFISLVWCKCNFCVFFNFGFKYFNFDMI